MYLNEDDNIHKSEQKEGQTNNNSCKVATLPKYYLTFIGIITQSLKLIGQLLISK